MYFILHILNYFLHFEDPCTLPWSIRKVYFTLSLYIFFTNFFSYFSYFLLGKLDRAFYTNIENGRQCILHWIFGANIWLVFSTKKGSQMMHFTLLECRARTNLLARTHFWVMNLYLFSYRGGKSIIIINSKWALSEYKNMWRLHLPLEANGQLLGVLVNAQQNVAITTRINM